LKLPNDLQDQYFKAYGRKASDDVVAFLKRELVHAILALMLDKDFVQAYKSGLECEIFDGSSKILLPRFVTWSADYKDK
jgi:hypothetical protein